ncbi:tRNA adenosine(34) deaminase TadA [Marinospirillum sp.]|uniref:tRNA adenosine(34) deaminase TadA n=1 Tax=Marinospirillum sp. TaxID=2183934 RepID=UPI002870835E|nr:tRNA adenosine(34) deaminase TadA [Marinospirillum sp.]MDR9466767.1 tRNA adenosine(34) deaminase TadA [Marinospirillum sp.]
MIRKPEYYMHRALELAEEAAAAGEVPVGAVVVQADGEIIGRGFNACISQCDASAHAEVQAIREAGKNLGNYRLSDCDLYVTLEPCTQCIGTLIHARIRKLYYGTKEPRTGAVASVCNLPAQPWFNHRLEVEGGLLQKQCKNLLEHFFQARRQDLQG